MVKFTALAATAALTGFVTSSPVAVQQSKTATLVPRQAFVSNSSNAQPWSWTSGSPMHGLSIGNMLILERWMDERWFIESCNNSDARDEWTWSQSLGDRAQSVLQDHWATWVTEDDIRIAAEAGFNTLRLPFGYWAFVTVPGTPYVSQGGQVDQITRILQYADKYGLYVVLDLHGLPGSQNGEQPSGHIGYNNWYQDQNQVYGDQTVDAVLEYVANSPYRNIISAFAPVNEPIYYSEDQFQTLLAFYERTYNKTSNMNPPLPMMFAPGKPEVSPFALYQQLINGKDPNLIIYEDHPYIGRLWALQSEDGYVNAVCARARTYQDYPVPIAITEWSVTTAIVNNTEWYQRFYAANARAWAQHAGGIFWSLRVNAYPGQYNQTDEFLGAYSFLDLYNAGDIPRPAPNQTTQQYIFSLPDECNFGNSTDTFPDVVPSVMPTVTNAFTAGGNSRRAVQTPAPVA